MNLPVAAAAASQLLLVDEDDVELLVEPCRACGHPEHGACCGVQVEVLRGHCAHGLAYVATGPCSCLFGGAGARFSAPGAH